MDVQRALAALAEPTRFRIVELLAERARTVGEVAVGVGALQPQTTKHLQALESAGVVRIHKLGRRRVARLDREAFAALTAYLADLARPDADDDALDAYELAVAEEERRAVGAEGSRVLVFERELAAPASEVWAAWTDPQRASAWWAPRHFQVGAFEIAGRAGAPVRVVLLEGDGARYESAGRVEEAVPGRRLVFTLAPLDAEGSPLFTARHTLHLTEGATTTIALTLEISDVRPEAAPAVAGLEPGWRQLLDALESSLTSPAESPPSA